jgi:type IV pilus assembly protein PilY1
MYSSNSGESVPYGSSPANISYSVFDGNYLNWKSQPNNVIMSRSNIMKEVTKKVLSSVNNLNVGLMRFNPTGPAGERGVGGSVT